MKAQLTIEFLTGLLLIAAVIALLIGSITLIEKNAIEHAEKSRLLAELQGKAQEFDCFFNAADITKLEYKHFYNDIAINCDADFCNLASGNLILINNSLVLEYKEGASTKMLIVRTLLYKGAGNEPI